ncbi:MAG: RluA family pseudouridine synthase [Planctomycetes bacterium]|nr:RluA family pseudouridine synthase [Planctomycetota bacterium]
MQPYTVLPEQIGMELNEFLSRLYPGVHKRHLRQLVRVGRININGQPAHPGHRLRDNEVVIVDVEDHELPQTSEVEAFEGEIPFLFEDEHVLAVLKPAGLAVEPDRWDDQRANLVVTVQGLVEARAAATGHEAFRPRLVHRLDRDTSGAMVLAKTVDAERVLGAAFEEARVHKRYLALVEGEHPLAEGEVEEIRLALAQDPKRTGQMCARRDGKEALTLVRVLQRFRGYTLLECEPRTGRTHQIRVHLSAKGFPLAVDPLYGRRRALLLSELKNGYRKKPGQVETPLIARLTLHAQSLEFPSVAEPGVSLRVEAPIPRDFARALKQLSKVRPPRR